MPEKSAHTGEGPARCWLRIGGAVLALALVAGAAALAWHWYRSIPVRRIVVEGAAQASPDSLVALARVDTGQALYRLDPRLVAGRAERHAWVDEARLGRSLDGTLRLAVAERTPAALVLSGDGEAAYYLDAAGHALPLPDSGDAAAPAAAFDVPLVRGLGEAYQSPSPLLRPAGHAPLRALLGALAENDTAGALISEIRIGEDGALTLRTVPAGGGQSAEVQLGRGAPAPKLRRLAAFWKQAVEAQKERTAFRQIDLRFDEQVVVRQEPLAPSDAPALRE